MATYSGHMFCYYQNENQVSCFVLSIVEKMLKKYDLNAISLLLKFRLCNFSWQLFLK